MLLTLRTHEITLEAAEKDAGKSNVAIQRLATAKMPKRNGYRISGFVSPC